MKYLDHKLKLISNILETSHAIKFHLTKWKLPVEFYLDIILSIIKQRFQIQDRLNLNNAAFL